MAGDNHACTFTVFTATYNRAHTLPRVYESLCQQTFRDFEWLIIDDGSTDDTEHLVRSWQAEADFPVRYVYQSNQGLNAALNQGVAHAAGELFLQFDSDNSCTPHALERFKYHWDSIPPDQRPLFSAVTALCMDQHGQLVGDRFPYDPTDSDSLEMHYRFKVKGEKWGFHRTDVLRHFPFPTIEGSFAPEGIVWHAIARKFKTRYVNEILGIYTRHEKGGSAQLSKQSSYAKSAPGSLLGVLASLNNDIDWFRYAPMAFLREAAYYSRFSFHSGRNIWEQGMALTNVLARALWFGTLPLGYAVYRLDTWRTRGR